MSWNNTIPDSMLTPAKRIGIVGSEGAKFTVETKLLAQRQIALLLHGATEVVSGGCHLGGIDQWAAEIGRSAGLRVTEFIPKSLRWSGGYKERNIQIAEYADVVRCITVKELPPGYSGMRFKLCYHCGTDEHVKSGGCWTVKYAKSLGKKGGIIVI